MIKIWQLLDRLRRNNIFIRRLLLSLVLNDLIAYLNNRSIQDSRVVKEEIFMKILLDLIKAI